MFCGSRRKLVMTKDETYWEDFPGRVVSVKADRHLNGKGRWTRAFSQITGNSRDLDLLIRARGSWCYAGTYATASQQKLSADGFEALPEKVCDPQLSTLLLAHATLGPWCACLSGGSFCPSHSIACNVRGWGVKRDKVYAQASGIQ